ncbi:MAG TPA: hypothetical protein VGE41_03520 [Verrucomicrobiae bacterium]|jgi:hypothetical protein
MNRLKLTGSNPLETARISASPKHSVLVGLNGSTNLIEIREEPGLFQAIEICQTQGKMLDKLRRHLEQMQHLASSTAQNGVIDEQGQEYQHHVCTVRQIAALVYNGQALFTGNTFVLSLDRGQNHLVMSGINLDTTQFAAIIQSNIFSREAAIEAQKYIEVVLQQLEMFESVLAANLGRLTFLQKQQGTISMGQARAA